MPIIYPTALGGAGVTDTTVSFSLTLPTAITSGSVLYVSGTTGEISLADQDGTNTREVIGIALETPTTTTTKIAVSYGSNLEVKFASPPTSSVQIGTPVYLSSTAGQATMTEPTSGTVYRLGVLLSNVVQSSGLYKILFMPVKVADLL